MITSVSYVLRLSHNAILNYVIAYQTAREDLARKIEAEQQKRMSGTLQRVGCLGIRPFEDKAFQSAAALHAIARLI